MNEETELPTGGASVAPDDAEADPTTETPESTEPAETPEAVAETPEQVQAKATATAKEAQDAQDAKLDALERDKQAAEREAQYWRSIAQPAKPEAVKPTTDKFEDYGDYVEALTRWTSATVAQEQIQAENTRRAADAQYQAFKAREAAFSAKTPDYAAKVTKSSAPVSAHVGAVLLESEYGPELAHHLGGDLDTLRRLNSMTPTQAARELGRIEAGFIPTKAVTATKKTTATPAPANTSTGQGRSTSPTLEKASMDEYVKLRKSQGARWAN